MYVVGSGSTGYYEACPIHHIIRPCFLLPNFNYLGWNSSLVICPASHIHCELCGRGRDGIQFPRAAFNCCNNRTPSLLSLSIPCLIHYAPVCFCNKWSRGVPRTTASFIAQSWFIPKIASSCHTWNNREKTILNSCSLSEHRPSCAPNEAEANDARWVGAWWLGYLIAGVLSVLAAIPFWFLPKHHT